MNHGKPFYKADELIRKNKNYVKNGLNHEMTLFNVILTYKPFVPNYTLWFVFTGRKYLHSRLWNPGGTGTQ